MNSINGIITPMVTPVSQGNVDEGRISELMAFIKGEGVSAAFPMGSTGLFPLFSKENHVKAIEVTVKHALSGMMVLAGAGRNDIDETLEVAKMSADAGADAVVIVTPFYIRMSQNSMLNYYSRIASALDSKIIAYNIPQFTGNSISAEMLSTLMKEHSNIIGVKDSSGDLRSTQKYISTLPHGAYIYQGQDDLLLPSMAIGVSGGVCGTTNFIGLAVRLWKSGSSGAESKSIQLRLSGIMRTISMTDFPKAYYYLFERLVMKNNKPRNYLPFPIEDLSAQEENALDRAVNLK
ncbi:MAG: dihydrodipicolinate synthase family protein [Nitrososphaerota archaeon]|nr:dihydrodipicolinate synthase family protein [Nitrososphaerota archaeon]